MREQNPAVHEAAEYLDQIPKFTKEKHTGETLRRMFPILGISEKGMKIIHVAGTNGKGSVCAFFASILQETGARTAVFTSPHLLSVKERFSFQGEEVGDEAFLQAFYRVKDHLEEFEQIGAGHPSYFEFLFLMFLVMVQEQPVDYVILETGLGGRLDATNSVEHPILTVITSISLDHMEYLGDTVEKIAAEKAGILKAGVPVVYDRTSLEAAGVIEAHARELSCPAWPVDRRSYEKLLLENGRLHLETGEGEGHCSLVIPFAAEYQAVNAMLAFRGAELLGIARDIIARGIKRTVWPGRMEEIRERVYLDGAHNEGGIREFARAAERMMEAHESGRRILLFAVVSDKEYEEMAEILCREFRPEVLILTQIHYRRGLDIEKLSGAASAAWQKVDQEEGKKPQAHDVRVIPQVAAALREALREKREEDTVFCAGSLYLIGELKEALKEE